VNPYAVTAAFLLGLAGAFSIRYTDTGPCNAVDDSLNHAVKEQGMSKTPPQWGNLTVMEKAVDHLLEAANDLAVICDECYEDDPYKGYLSHAVNLLRDMATALLPPREGWPEPKDGYGKILPFIPRQTG
jgi:hypothetical protein